MEKKFTQGPWIGKKSVKDRKCIVIQCQGGMLGGYQIAKIKSALSCDQAEAEANAKAIAAVPDLLEACQYVVDYHRDHDSGEGELYGLDFVTTCIAAIRKATG